MISKIGKSYLKFSTLNVVSKNYIHDNKFWLRAQSEELMITYFSRSKKFCSFVFNEICSKHWNFFNEPSKTSHFRLLMKILKFLDSIISHWIIPNNANYWHILVISIYVYVPHVLTSNSHGMKNDFLPKILLLYLHLKYNSNFDI